MLLYPHINPIALNLGPVKIHWYGIMYLVGFSLAFLLGIYRAKKSDAWNTDLVSDLIVYCALGVVIGGRLGFFLFYNLDGLLRDPLSLFKIWQGGMAFHGGAIGVFLALWLFARKTKKKISEVADFLVPLVPLGLGMGRLGNFINGELWGRVTNVPWAMVFPHVGPEGRHPSQIYEFLLEGVLLFTILWLYTKKPRAPWAPSGMFLLGYGVLRFLVEFVREMDPVSDPVAFGWLTMGQVLSIPMIIIGAWLIFRPQKRNLTGVSDNHTGMENE